jgi:uncharacterized iron-regulated membrane protein
MFIRDGARRLHGLLASFVGVPSAVILISGVTLQLRQDFDWIQPRAKVGKSLGIPTLPLSVAFERARAVSEADVLDWNDITSMEIKPARGLIQIRARNGYEVQLDGTTGEVLAAAPRRTGMLIELHQGSFFHPLVMKWVFLPAGLGLIFIWGTGVHMSLQRRKRRVSS